MSGELRVPDGFDQRLACEKCDDLPRVLDVPGHPQGKRLDPLQDLERRERRHARAEVADALARCAQEERGGRGLLREHHVVEARIGLGQRRELAARGGVASAAIPVEAPESTRSPPITTP